jgi:hypothetical protein
MKEYKAWVQNGFLGLLLIAIFVGLGIVLLINT